MDLRGLLPPHLSYRAVCRRPPLCSAGLPPGGQSPQLPTRSGHRRDWLAPLRNALLAGALLTLAPAAAHADSVVVFNEIMYHPATNETALEWVELYNTSGRTLDIAGYSFHDDASDEWVFDASVLVAPHGYMVLCANMNPRKNGGVSCDGWFYRQPMGEAPPPGSGHGGGVAIANNDDELELTAPDGTDIDLFDYNDTNSDPIEDAMSFGLDPSHMNGVDNDDVGNWCIQTTIQSGMTEAGTPGQPEVREYRVLAVYKNREVGLPSDILTATVGE